MEPLKCAIRAMTGDDRAAVFYLGEEVLRPLAEAGGHPERFATGDLMDLLETAEVFVADRAGEIIGYAAVETEAGALVVRSICVSPAHEAQHVAHQLLAWAEGVGFDRGVERIRALLPVDDVRSGQLYDHRGFIVVPISDRPDVILREKPLPRP
jgi:N-acetylglutamate synthase-like GNAT family acetyltransferase